ncbi:MAG: hypothetical protein Q9227_004965 [Pyrenula ochraceoflavens]
MGSIKQGRSYELAQELFDKYGKTYITNSWGKTVVHTCEPENFRAVLSSLSSKFIVAPLRHDALEPLLGEGIFVTDGIAHENSRTLLKPVFASVQNRDSILLEKHLQKVIDQIPKDGSTIDIQPLFQSLFINVSAELLLGQSMEDADTSRKPVTSSANVLKPFLDELRKALKLAGLRIFFGKFRFLLRDGQKMRNACNQVHVILDRMIKGSLNSRTKSRKPASAPKNFIESLAEVVSDSDTRRSELLNVLLPSLDTTALALSDIFFQISRNPHVWKRLRTDVLELQEPLNFQTVKSLIYVRWVVNEGKTMSENTNAKLTLS